MRANFISTGFLVLATMAFQASAAPVTFFNEPASYYARELASEPTHHFKRSMQLDLLEIDNRHFGFEELEQRAPQGSWNNFVNAAKSAGHKAKEVITSPPAKAAFLGAATMATEYGVRKGIQRLRGRDLEVVTELGKRQLLERNLEDLLARARFYGDMNGPKSLDLHHSDVKLSARDLQSLLELDERDLEDFERRIAIMPFLAKLGPTVAQAAYKVYKKIRN